MRVYRTGPDGTTWYDVATGGSAASAVTLTGDVTGSGSVDPSNGLITINTTLTGSGTDNQIIVDDINNVTTISLADVVDLQTGLNVGVSNQGFINIGNGNGGNAGTISADSSGRLVVAADNSDLILTADSGIIDATNNEIHTQKTEYHRGGTNQGIIAATSDSNLTVTGLNSLKLESNSGNVIISPSSNFIDAKPSEIGVQKVSLWRNGGQQGVIEANSDNGVHLTSISGPLVLESNANDDVTINAPRRLNINTPDVVIGGSYDTFVRVQDSSGNDVVKIDSGLASDEAYHGYNSYTTTKVIELNGFIKLSSENNPATGYLYVNANTNANEAAPTLHLESAGDLALRAGANGDEGNVILYTGETSSGQPGKAYVGWGNSRYDANPDGEIATVGRAQTLTSKTLVSPTLNGPISITDGGGSQVGILDGDSGTLLINSTNGDIGITSDANLIVHAGTSTFNGDVSITGNLNVQGTLTAINKTEIDISDNTLVLNSNVTTGTPTEDAAIQVLRGSANTVGIVWSEGNKDWTLTNDGSNYFAIARKFVSVIGDGSNTSYDITHNLGTRDLQVQVYKNSSSYDVVETDILMKDANTVTIGFAVAPSTNAYKVVIVG